MLIEFNMNLQQTANEHSEKVVVTGTPESLMASFTLNNKTGLLVGNQS